MNSGLTAFTSLFYLLCMFYGGFISIGIGSLFSILLLCKIIDMACCVAIMFISLKVFLIACSGILNFFSRIFIDGICDVALVPAMITISGSIFQPLFVIFFINGWYFSIFIVIFSRKKLSIQYVNSMNCIVRLLSGSIGGFV